jgi:BirA family transcriptional regulator, biotin operon repressor / biotin---[acetyl-CoA-carboxylase] ligase
LLAQEPLIILSSTGSTNNYAMAKLHAGMVAAGTCFMAIEQTAGKGQRGKSWEVRAGENITMSTVLQPAVYEPFLYSATMALACYDFIKGFGVENVKIKWPNDIYIGDRKAAGILIENMMRGSKWEWAVIGTGVNLNQEEFPVSLVKAISLKQVTGVHHDLVSSARVLHRHILSRHRNISADIMAEYNAMLYKKNKEVRLKQGAVSFNTMIKEVLPSGELITYDTMERKFSVGEVEFIL